MVCGRLVDGKRDDIIDVDETAIVLVGKTLSEFSEGIQRTC